MIKVNDTVLDGFSVRYNGAVLTLTGKNPGMTLPKLAALFSGNPVITVIEKGSTVGIYQSMQMNALTMETVGGVLQVTAAMAAKPMEQTEGDGEELKSEIAQIREMAENAMAAVTAIEEGMHSV